MTPSESVARPPDLQRAGPPVAAFAILALSTLYGCSGGGDDGQTLLVYSPHGRDLLELVETRFEAEHPGVDLRWLDMGSQEVYDRLRSERVNPQADVWFGGPATIFARGAEDGLLEPYEPAWAQAVPESSRRADHLYFGLYRTPAVLVYNTQEVSKEEAPTDWDDLLAPRFEDRIIIRDPMASGTMRTFFGLVLARAEARDGSPEAGFQWLARLDAQTKSYVQNPALLHERLQRGEGAVTVWDLTDILLQQQRGAPFEFVFPASGTPVIDDSIGLVAGAPRGELGRTFIDWVGSAELQTLAAREVFRLPARTDLPPEALPPWAQRVFEELEPAESHAARIEAEGADWMRRWDREIRGRGDELTGRE